MSERYDAIIIGAGIIGANLGFELSKVGYATLNIDKLPAAGYGSTSNSCAIIRTHYSTVDGAAHGLRGLSSTGRTGRRTWASKTSAASPIPRSAAAGLLETDAQRHLKHGRAHLDALGIPYEDWEPTPSSRRLPVFDLARHGPPKRAGRSGFGEPTGGGASERAVLLARRRATSPIRSSRRTTSSAPRRPMGARFRFNAEVTAIRRRTAGSPA